MRWFRDHIRQSSWLALVAIAINFAVAFGHVHAIDGTASGRGPAALVAATTSSDGDQTQNHPADRADYLCPICMAAAAIGSDTGGSCRIPAALCGLAGFKPTAARIPLEGAVPLSSSYDSIGSIAPSVVPNRSLPK